MDRVSSIPFTIWIPNQKSICTTFNLIIYTYILCSATGMIWGAIEFVLIPTAEFGCIIAGMPAGIDPGSPGWK